VALLVGVMGLHDCATAQTLTCERRDGRPRCELRVKSLFSDRQAVYEDALLREARTAKTSGKGRSYEISFLDQRGHERRVMSGVDREEGERVVAFMNDPKATAVKVEKPRDLRGVVLGVVLLLVTLRLVAMAWRATLMLVMRVSADARTIHMIYTRLGIPYRRRTLQVPRRVASVDVRLTHRAEWWKQKYEPAHPYCRIEIRGDGEPAVELIGCELPGEPAHRRVAERLSALLIPGWKPTETKEPLLAPERVPWLGITRRRWRQAGIFVAVLVTFSAIMMVISDHSTGTLTLHCEFRCRLGGGECLPGGSFTQTMDPGRYQVEVWAPHLPSKWQAFEVEIERGRTTEFVCRPSR
jgi:hypothetical protein